MIIIPAFQAGDAGLIPATRSMSSILGIDLRVQKILYSTVTT